MNSPPSFLLRLIQNLCAVTARFFSLSPPSSPLSINSPFKNSFSPRGWGFQGEDGNGFTGWWGFCWRGTIRWGVGCEVSTTSRGWWLCNTKCFSSNGDGKRGLFQRKVGVQLTRDDNNGKKTKKYSLVRFEGNPLIYSMIQPPI